MRKIGTILFGFILVMVVAGCSEQEAAQVFSAVLGGQNEVPPVVTNGSGNVTLTVDGNTVTIAGSYSDLSGPATAAHIHGPAPAGQNAGVLFTLTVTEGATAGSGTLSGTTTDFEVDNPPGVSTQQDQSLRLSDLLASGEAYINVHTANNPPGEIRGQLTSTGE